jgi:carbamoyl-phosphate synthase large subunit
VTDAAAFADAIVDSIREYPTAAVIPMSDATIAAVAPARERLAKLGCFLALAPAMALEAANDKDRTLRIAAELGIQVPQSVSIGSVAGLPAAVAEFGFPFVLKPTMSWTGNSDTRAVPVEVINGEEAVRATERFLAEGAGILAQEFIGGRRERVALFLVDGEVMANCAHAAERMSPPFGGVSTLRESIPAPADILDASIQLALAIGIQGPCEVEFRRDAQGRPRLMEVNARLAGTLAHTKASGVDLSLLTWQWATGHEVSRVKGYRTGVRTRWLLGDMFWLVGNYRRQGRPDGVPRGRSVWLFLREFARIRHYDHLDWRDLRPAILELKRIIAVSARVLPRHMA